jgi:hypothetical protein
MRSIVDFIDLVVKMKSSLIGVQLYFNKNMEVSVVEMKSLLERFLFEWSRTLVPGDTCYCRLYTPLFKYVTLPYS